MPTLQTRYRVLATIVLSALVGLMYLGVSRILHAVYRAGAANPLHSTGVELCLPLLFCVFLALLLAFFHWLDRWYRHSCSHAIRSELYIDPLTGAWNRRAAEADLAHLFHIWKTGRVNSAVYFLDIDDFKRVNDRWGHGAGDVVLQGVVAQLQKALRQSDKIYRWGGEEFVVLCEGVDASGSRCLGAAIVDAVAACEPLPAISVTASVGMSVFFSEDTQYLQALNRADRAMYHAKRSGKNHAARHVRAGAPVVCMR